MIKKRTFQSILYEWLNNKAGYVKESTHLKYYNQIEKNIAPYFNNISFKSLNIKQIESFFNTDAISELSNSTKNNILVIIKASINYGIKKIIERLLKRLILNLLQIIELHILVK